ncbi:MAG: hypothetical protein U0Y68_13150 [Blastocatellia bacterium]
MVGGRSAEQILQEVAKDASAVIAWGSVALARLCAKRKAESN